MSDKRNSVIIGVAGGRCAGKTTVCKRIMEKLGEVRAERQVVCISQDSFYKDLNQSEIFHAEKEKYNLEDPDAFDVELFLQTLEDLRSGKTCEIPIYDNKNKKPKQSVTIYPADVILVEGTLIFHVPQILDLFNLKLFAHADADTRLARFLSRESNEREGATERIIYNYMKWIKPSYDGIIYPTIKVADIIIPCETANQGWEEILHNVIKKIDRE